MKDLGIPEEKTKPDLKRLLQLCDKNWELIEEKTIELLLMLFLIPKSQRHVDLFLNIYFIEIFLHCYFL